MLTLILITKLVCEVALLCLLGRGALAVMAGERRHTNFFYGLFRAATQPWVRGVGMFTPAVVLPRHHPWVAFWCLAVAWLVVTWAKVVVCLDVGVAHCQ